MFPAPNRAARRRAESFARRDTRSAGKAARSEWRDLTATFFRYAELLVKSAADELEEDGRVDEAAAVRLALANRIAAGTAPGEAAFEAIKAALQQQAQRDATASKSA